MAEWVPRTIVDQQVEFPYRYELRDVATGDVIGTYDIHPVRSAGDVEGTEPNAAYLQPIEDFLGQIQGDLNALGVEIAALESDIKSTENTLSAEIQAVDTRVTAANKRMGDIDTAMGLLAPLANPTLTNPRANTVAITSNNTALATTAAVRSYLDSLMASYKG